MCRGSHRFLTGSLGPRVTEATQAETRDKLLLLKDQLEEAQADRIKKIEYDKRAKEINKLPDRAKGQE